MAVFKKKPPLPIGEGKFLTKNLGVYYTRKGKYIEAMKYLNDCLDNYIEEDDADVIHRRCQAMRALANTDQALKDAVYASSLNKHSPHMAMSVVETLHELNQFENSAIKINDQIKYFKGNFRKDFENKLDVLHSNIDDSAGDAYFSYINKAHKVLLEAWRSNQEARRIDDRPLWKIRKEMAECDVLSVLDKEKPLVPPVEMARRSTAFTVFSQNYLQRSWVDVLFLRALPMEESLNCPQLVESTPHIHNIVRSVNKNVKAFMEMLHARNPLYNIEYRMCPQKHRMKINREKMLNIKQYQTHRTMHNSLRTIKHLVKIGEIERLTNFVESLMGDYVLLKTSRVMPWKIEFLNEVYNSLALAYLEQYRSFRNSGRLNQKLRLRQLFKLPVEDQVKRIEAKFGDMSMYKEENIAESNLNVHKKFLDRMEKRHIFSKYDIERAYISHQMANSHLKWNNFDKCVAIAQKGVREARSCNSYAWELLNLFLVCKAQISLRKLEILKDTLSEAFRVSQLLRDLSLIYFVEFSSSLTGEILSARRSVNYGGSITSRRSRQTTSMTHSRQDSQSTFDHEMKLQNELDLLQTL